jgi:PAP2 superfamily
VRIRQAAHSYSTPNSHRLVEEGQSAPTIASASEARPPAATRGARGTGTPPRRIVSTLLAIGLIAASANASGPGSAVLQGSGEPILRVPEAFGCEGSHSTGEISPDSWAAMEAGELPAPAAPSPPSYPRLLMQNALDVLSAPRRWDSHDWRVFSLDVAGVGLVALADRSLSDAARHPGRFQDHVASLFEPFGAELSFGTLGAFYVGGLLAHDAKAKDVAMDGLAASLIASGLITPALKELAGRSRPNQNRGTYRFKPFSGDASFPSGHVTQAFAVASTISAEYDSKWVSIAAYAPASLVGFARVRHWAHFPSDVVAGALIGHGVGRAVVHWNRKHRAQPALSLSPLFGLHGSQGLQASLSF